LVVVTFSAFYLGVAIARGPNIGYRHLLPVVPFLHQLAAIGIVTLWQRRRVAVRAVLGLGALYYGATTWAVHPYELTFFNALIGGPGQGYRYLVSSNVEWGQSAKALQAFLAARGEKSTYLAYTHPAPYDVSADHALAPAPEGEAMASPLHPTPGLYLIGATSLQIPSSCCEVGLQSYGWFRHREPSISVGNAVLGYEVSSQDRPQWVIQCANSAPPLSAETLRRGLAGSEAIRTLTIDCTQVWLYPDAGRSPGIVALPEEAFAQKVPRFQCRPRLLPCPNRSGDPFVDGRLAPMRLSYQQPAGYVPPPFRLYESGAAPAMPDGQRGYPAPADAQPAALSEGQPLPLAFDGPLTLLGVEVLTEDPQVFEIATWWRVTGAPPSEPISLMAHLLEGETVTVGDALDLPVALWRPGDVFVQRHSFAPAPSPDVSESGWLRLGVYALGSGERWPQRDWPARDALFISVREMLIR
jgi:hypothetical protein